MPPSAFAPGVPVVGLPITVHEGIVMATVTCRCRPDNATLLIRGTDQAAVCKHCSNMYAIVKVEYEPLAGQQLQVSVSMVGRHVQKPDS